MNMARQSKPWTNHQHSIFTCQGQYKPALPFNTQKELNAFTTVTTPSLDRNCKTSLQNSPASSKPSLETSEMLTIDDVNLFTSTALKKNKPLSQMHMDYELDEPSKQAESIKDSSYPLNNRPTRTRKPTDKAMELVAGGSKLFSSLKHRCSENTSPKVSHNADILTRHTKASDPRSIQHDFPQTDLNSDIYGELQGEDTGQASTEKPGKCLEKVLLPSASHKEYDTITKMSNDLSEPYRSVSNSVKRGSEAKVSHAPQKNRDSETIRIDQSLAGNSQSHVQPQVKAHKSFKKRRTEMTSKAEDEALLEWASLCAMLDDTEKSTYTSEPINEVRAPDSTLNKTPSSAAKLESSTKDDSGTKNDEGWTMIAFKSFFGLPMTPGEIDQLDERLAKSAEVAFSSIPDVKLTERGSKRKRPSPENRITTSTKTQQSNNPQKLSNKQVSMSRISEHDEDRNIAVRSPYSKPAFEQAESQPFLKKNLCDSATCNLDCLDEVDTILAFAEIATYFPDQSPRSDTAEKQNESQSLPNSELSELLQSYCQCQGRSDNQAAPHPQASTKANNEEAKSHALSGNRTFAHGSKTAEFVPSNTLERHQARKVKLNPPKKTTNIKLKLRVGNGSHESKVL